MSSRNLVLALVALLVGAAAGLVTAPGTGSAGPGDEPEMNLVAHAVGTAESAGTVSMTYTMDIRADGLPTMGFDGTGGFDFATGRGAMVMRATGDLAAFGGAGFEMEMRFDGSTVYLRMPGLEEMGAAATPWVSIDLGAVGDGDLWGSTGGSDPTQTLQLLRGASSDIQDLGRETVGGHSTTHYRAVVDLDKVVDATPPEQRAAVEQAIGMFEASGIDEFPVDVWIDDDGLPRRELLTMSIPAADGFPGGELEMDVYYPEYGSTVDVAPPAPGQVTDVTGDLGAYDGFLA